MCDQKPNADECFAITKAVLEKMVIETAPFVTPISRVIEHDYGELEGSGSYIEIDGQRYLITNEHVAARLKTHSIGHQFAGSSNVYRSAEPFVTDPYPADVGLRIIGDNLWNDSDHSAAPIPFCRFAAKHSPVDGELFFIAGFAGARARFHFGQLNCERITYLMQADAFPQDHGEEDFHFAIAYRPDLARTTDALGQGLPDPHGLSGTLVWNTRFIEITCTGGVWSPEQAQVTGIVWGWPSGDACLLATRVERLELREIVEAIRTFKTEDGGGQPATRPESKRT